MYPSEYSTSWMKGRQESDRGNMRAGLRKWQISDVFAQDQRESAVVALAEEISFTDGLVGKGAVKRGSGQRNTKNHKQAGAEATHATHQNFPARSIAPSSKNAIANNLSARRSKGFRR